jgi:hypothetical protein
VGKVGSKKWRRSDNVSYQTRSRLALSARQARLFAEARMFGAETEKVLAYSRRSPQHSVQLPFSDCRNATPPT